MTFDEYVNIQNNFSKLLPPKMHHLFDLYNNIYASDKIADAFSSYIKNNPAIYPLVDLFSSVDSLSNYVALTTGFSQSLLNSSVSDLIERLTAANLSCSGLNIGYDASVALANSITDMILCNPLENSSVLKNFESSTYDLDNDIDSATDIDDNDMPEMISGNFSIHIPRPVARVLIYVLSSLLMDFLCSFMPWNTSDSHEESTLQVEDSPQMISSVNQVSEFIFSLHSTDPEFQNDIESVQAECIALRESLSLPVYDFHIPPSSPSVSSSADNTDISNSKSLSKE